MRLRSMFRLIVLFLVAAMWLSFRPVERPREREHGDVELHPEIPIVRRESSQRTLGAHGFGTGHLGQALDPRLRLLGLRRAGLEAVDEALQVRALGLHLLVVDLLHAQVFGALVLDRTGRLAAATGDDEDRKDRMRGLVVELLERAGAVCIFPEGTRSPDGELQEFKPGMVFMAEPNPITASRCAVR